MCIIIFTLKKKNCYNFILIIFDWLIKIKDYKLMNKNINNTGLTKFIIYVLAWQYNFLDWIVIKKTLLLTLKL